MGVALPQISSTGVVIALCVPMWLGILLIPALTAHLFAANMRQLTIFASLLGGAVSFLGFCIAYRYDLPVGPADVVLLWVIHSLAFLARKIFRLNRGGEGPRLP
jgi:zinc/manganese transport system permease protein